jgi:protein phosphatase 1 regulatory subunit 37
MAAPPASPALPHTPTNASASSSAVTIPVPGKSILKRPPPPPQSFLSTSFARLSKLLPTQQPAATASSSASSASGTAAASSGSSSPSSATEDPERDRALRRAHFILPQLATVYPISAANPPSSPAIREEKRAVEAREAQRRRRVVRGNAHSSPSSALAYSPGGGSARSSVSGGAGEAASPVPGPGPGPVTVPEAWEDDEWWDMDKVESFYRECCEGREEEPNPGVSQAFKVGMSVSLSVVRCGPFSWDRALARVSATASRPAPIILS